MAKKVQPIEVSLGIKGAEKISALKSSFRDLGKTIGLTDSVIEDARKDIIAYGKSATQSEALIKGQIKAFEGLREQAELGGKVYSDLSNDINKLQSNLRGSSDGIERQRQSLSKLGATSKISANELRFVITQLEKLKSKVREDSAAFSQLNKDINKFNVTLKEIETSAGKARFAISTIISAKPEKITGQIEKLSAAIASGKLEAEDLNIALSKLELLRIGAGRTQVAFRADLFSSELGFGYFARLRKEYNNLEKTQAAISQRISEVNTELTNVTGYERRRSLTLELIRLNKDLQQSIVDVTTREQFQAMAIRQRMGGARESYAASGFGAFSAEVTRRSAAGAYDPGTTKALERARNRVIDEEAVRTATGVFDTWVNAYELIENAANNHKVEMSRIQAAQGDLLIQIEDRKNDQKLRQQQAQYDEELRLFDQKLKQRDRFLQRSGSIKGLLGLSGQELSPLYENIVGIGAARARGEQARMGRTPQESLADIINVFNSDLNRTGDGFLDSERKLREAAIDFAGGSKKVRQRFEEFPLGKTPKGIFPQSGESEESYRKRIEVPERNLFEGIKSFVDRLKRTGNGFLDSEKKIRESAIKFANNSVEVERAFSQVPLGKTPISMFPRELETPESYVQRIRGGFSQLDLPDFSNFRKATTRELQLTRESLSELRLDLDPLAASFEKTEKRIVDSISGIDKELVSRQRGRRRLSGGQVAQAAGAAISGGIFGGPEGFLGGVGGALVGGVGGAFTGAAFGAQLGGIRRQLGEFAAYAAQIEKLKISLKGITGSQEEYSRALAAAAGATEKLNVPQETAIQGITRLTAAVKGAGGGVADAELAFNSINSAIIATGGGAEQVEGAITALVQIFSKGKVSAEEINQIAERLPGTFNKIAEASGRTGPELTKALQDGTVGLNDLQKFLISLGSEYGDLAEKIANSSESAGARLQKSFDTLRKNVGDALQPVGAEFQNAFAEFIAEITPSLVESAKAIGRGLKFILENREIIGLAATFALKVAAVNFALKAFAALNGPISSTFALLKTGFKATTQQASLAQTRLINFGNTVKALALSVAAPIVITFVVIGAQQVIAYFNRIKKARADLDKTFEAPRGVDYFKAIGGKAATRQKLLTEIGNITKASNILRERIETNKTSLQELQDTAAVTYGGAGSSGAAIADPSGPSREDLRTRIQADEAELQRLIDNYQELKRNLPKAKDERDALTQFPGPTIDTETGKASRDAGIRDAERKAEEIAQLQRQLAQSNARKAILEIDKKISATRIAIVDAQDQQNFAGERALKGLLNTLEFERQKLEINSEYNAAVREIRETTEGQAAELREQIATQDSLIKSENLKLELKEKQISAQQDLNRLTKEQSKTFEEQFTDRQRQLGLISRDDFNKILLEREESSLRGKRLTPEQRERGLEQLRQEIDPTPFEIVTKKVTELKDQLEDLTNIGNIVANSANAIGDAFSQSFTDIITGSKSTKEALSDFFKSVGSFFLDLAKQVIAKLIQIAILNAVTGLLPGLSGSGGGGGAGKLLQGVNNPLKIADSSGFNLGGFFADGGKPPINKPSIVGERGPELFVPFQQGTIVSNEDLQEQMAKAGLPSMERSSSSRFRETREVMVPFTRSAEQLSVASAERETAQAISNPGPLDVRFESQVINNVEYVTADQYRKGMSQAAERGRALTLEALQNSVKARKRIGL